MRVHIWTTNPVFFCYLLALGLGWPPNTPILPPGCDPRNRQQSGQINRDRSGKRNPVLKIRRAKVTCAGPKGAQLRHKSTDAILRANREERETFFSKLYLVVFFFSRDNLCLMTATRVTTMVVVVELITMIIMMTAVEATIKITIMINFLLRIVALKILIFQLVGFPLKVCLISMWRVTFSLVTALYCYV